MGPLAGFGFQGDGTAFDPYPASMIPLPVGTPFGWYLETPSDTYFSQPGLNTNSQGLDHTMTFDLPLLNGTSTQVDFGAGAETYTFHDPFLIGWEDLPLNVASGILGDEDYDDLMYIADRVQVPEPATMFLLGTGLAGLVGLRRRFKK